MAILHAAVSHEAVVRFLVSWGGGKAADVSPAWIAAGTPEGH